MFTDRDAVSRAFNAGCDARLAGKPLTANPYRDTIASCSLNGAWHRGWHDVNYYWGRNIGGCWHFRELPEVTLRMGVPA